MKKWTIIMAMTISIVGITIGCQKKEATKEDVYSEFQKKISVMSYYKCKADVEVIGNKSAHKYEFIHTYNKPDNYRLEVLSPKHLKGKTMEYEGDIILVKNPDINDVIELPNIGENNQYMFIGDFIKNYLQNEEVEIKLSKENLSLETYIPGDNQYFNKQVLYIDLETRLPEKMEILDKTGEKRFIINYKDFEYKK